MGTLVQVCVCMNCNIYFKRRIPTAIDEEAILVENQKCPRCESTNWIPMGIDTESLEDEIPSILRPA